MPPSMLELNVLKAFRRLFAISAMENPAILTLQYWQIYAANVMEKLRILEQKKTLFVKRNTVLQLSILFIF